MKLSDATAAATIEELQGPPPPGHLLARAQSPDSAAPELAFTGAGLSG